MYEMPPQCLEMRQMSRPASHDEFQQGRQGQGGAVDDVELSRGLAQRAVRLDQPKTVGNQESCCKIYGFPIGCWDFLMGFNNFHFQKTPLSQYVFFTIYFFHHHILENIISFKTLFDLTGLCKLLCVAFGDFESFPQIQK